MDQLFYTSCRTGHSVDGGSGGFKLRAVSEGLTQIDLQKKGNWGYQLPDHTFDLSSAPVRLAFLPFNESEFSLIHTVYVGSDPDTGRAGNYFTHIVFTPDSTTSRDAICTWESPEWQLEDGEYDARLPSRDALPRNETFKNPSESISAFAQDQNSREMICWLITALQGTCGSIKQIILVGESNYLAWLIHSALHLLPLPICRGITFSTYEKTPLTVPATIVGTQYPKGKAVPPSFFQAPNATLDTNSRRKTELPFSAYSKLIEQKLKRGKSDHILQFVTLLDQEAALDATRLEQLSKMAAEESLDRQTHIRMLEEISGATLSAFLTTEDQWKPIAESICAEGEISEELATRVHQMPPEGKSALHRTAFEQIASALQKGDQKNLDSKVHHILPLSGYPVDQGWVSAYIESEMATASLECRLIVYHWLKRLPNLEAIADTWIYSTPLQQIEKHCGNKWSKRPEEFTSEILSEALFRHAFESPAEVGMLIPKISEDLLPFLVTKFHQSQHVPESQKIQILQSLIASALSAGLKQEAACRFSVDSSSQNLQLQALYQIDPALASAARPRASLQAELDPELVAKLDQLGASTQASTAHVEPSSSTDSPESSFSSQPDAIPQIDPMAGEKIALKDLSFDQAGLKKVGGFVSRAQSRSSETEIASVVSRAIADHLKLNQSHEGRQSPSLEKLADFLRKVARLLQSPTSARRSRMGRPREESLAQFWETLLAECQGAVQTPLALCIASLVAEALADSKIRGECDPLVSFLKGLRNEDSRLSGGIPSYALKIINSRARKMLKKHWDSAPR